MRKYSLHFLMITLTFFLTSRVFAQTNTWNGGTGAWDISANWSLLHAPLATEDVVIPNGGEVTIFSIGSAQALTITIQTGAMLNLKPGAILNVNSGNATTDRINNKGDLFNEGTITIGNLTAGEAGLLNSSSTAQVLNNGVITIDNFEGNLSYAINNENGAGITNSASGEINITDAIGGSASSAMLNTGAGSTITNQGELTINNVRAGITNVNDAVWNNEGILYLGDIRFNAGIENLSGAIFHNKSSGEITLEVLNAVPGIEGIYNSAIFINDSDIEVISPSGEGFENRLASGYFENNDNLLISGSAATYGFINSSFATWAGDGFISSNKPVLNNWVYQPIEFPSKMDIEGHLIHFSNAKDTFQIEGAAGTGVAGGNDFIDVNGNLTLSGELVINTINGFVPSLGDQFLLFQYTGSLSGSFTTVTLPPGFSGYSIDAFEAGNIYLRNPNCITRPNTWIGGTGNWEIPSNWDLGHVPMPCEDVVIGIGDSVILNSGAHYGRSLVMNGAGMFLSDFTTELLLDGLNSKEFGLNINNSNITNHGQILIQNFSGNSATGINIVQSNVINHFFIDISNITGNAGFGMHMNDLSSSFRSMPGSLIEIDSTDGPGLRNSGSMSLEGTLRIQNCGDEGIFNLHEIVQTASGVLEINQVVDNGIDNLDASFINEGSITIDSCRTGILNDINSIFTNDGSIDISNTIFQNLVNSSNSYMNGNGSYVVEINFFNEGRLSPGHSPGILTIDGKLLQNINSIDTFDMGGNAGGGDVNGHDSIYVNGDLDLDGKLVVQLLNGFVPADDDQYTIMQYTGLLIDTFITIELPPSMPGWGVNYSYPGIIFLEKNVCNQDTNIWVGGDSKWNINSNWSLGHIPRRCEDVIINAPNNVAITSGNIAEARSIAIMSGSTFLIETGASLTIDMQNIQYKIGLNNMGEVTMEGDLNIRNSFSAWCIGNYGSNFTNSGNITISNLIGNNAVGIGCSGASFMNAANGVISISDFQFISSASITNAVNSHFENLGVINIHKAGSFANLGGAQFDNYGTITSDSVMAGQAMNLGSNSMFHNHNTGNLIFTNSLQNGSLSHGITANSSGTILINDGEIELTNIGHTGMVFVNDAHLENNGMIDISNTGLISAGGVDAKIDGALLSGNGELYGDNTIILDGYFSPGNSPGTLYFEDHILHTSGNVDTFEIGGTSFNSFDHLDILDGNLTMDGKIVIKLISGFIPSELDEFAIITFSGGSVTGNFSIVELPLELAGWELQYNQVDVRLIKPACTSAINSWIGTVGNWNIPGNWSLGHVPRYCEDVFFTSTADATIPTGYQAVAHSVEINGGDLEIGLAARLVIDVSNDSKQGFANGGTVANYGALYIQNTSGLNADGLINEQGASFTNETLGTINISNIAGGLSEGLVNLGFFNNEGIVNISDVVNSNGLFNSLNGTEFYNSSGINITNVQNDGIQNLSSALLDNIGVITIENAGRFGIFQASNAMMNQGGAVWVK